MSTGYHKNLPTLPDGYKYIRELSSGNYGIVWLVQNNNVKRNEAMKILFRKGEIDYRRFCLEIETMAALSHPNIVTVYYAKPDELYFIMEYLENSLSSWFKQKNYSSFEGIKFLHQVANGLHFAHEKNLIHRDLKPGNILLTRDNVPKITDFGLVKNAGLSDAGKDDLTGSLSIGTPRYMSPEQWEDSKIIDCRTDIWAMGVMLYEIIAKENPFADLSGFQLADAIIRKPIQPPSQITPSSNIWEKLAEPICMRALKRDLDERYQTAYEMAKDLEKIFNIEDETIEIVTEEKLLPFSFARTSIRPKKTKRKYRGVILIILVFLISASVYMLLQKNNVKKQGYKKQILTLNDKMKTAEKEILTHKQEIQKSQKIINQLEKDNNVSKEIFEEKKKWLAQNKKLLGKNKTLLLQNKDLARQKKLQKNLFDQTKQKIVSIMKENRSLIKLNQKHVKKYNYLLIKNKNQQKQYEQKILTFENEIYQNQSLLNQLKEENTFLQKEFKRLIFFENALYHISLVTKNSRQYKIQEFLKNRGFNIRRTVGVGKTKNVCVYYSKKNPAPVNLEKKVNYLIKIMKHFNIRMKKKWIRGNKEKEIKLELGD